VVAMLVAGGMSDTMKGVSFRAKTT
jgi:hypothetical protein